MMSNPPEIELYRQNMRMQDRIALKYRKPFHAVKGIKVFLERSVVCICFSKLQVAFSMYNATFIKYHTSFCNPPGEMLKFQKYVSFNNIFIYFRMMVNSSSTELYIYI